jgi:hypothetical protein
MNALSYRPKWRSRLTLLVVMLSLLAASLAPYPPSSVAAETPPANPQLLLLPFDAPQATNRIWRYADGAWTGLPLPLAHNRWQWLAADPADPDRWLLLSYPPYSAFWPRDGYVQHWGGGHGLYFTADAGATWAAVPLPISNEGGQLGLQKVEFDPATPGAWMLTGGNANNSYLWRGQNG